MEQVKSAESGFAINNILLMTCNFTRIPNVTFDLSLVENSFNIQVAVDVQGDVILVSETATMEQKKGAEVEFSIIVQMIGMFEKKGNTTIDLHEFGEVNGAAIIFPYVREQITSLSLKAGLNPIIVPPANFTKKNDQKSE